MIPEKKNIHRSSVIAGIAAVTASAACWGTSGIFISLIMAESDMTATALAFWRDTTTFFLFLCICALFRRRELRIRRCDWPWLALMGVSLGLFHVSWNLGISLNGPAITTVQQAAMPVIVIAVARIAWREPLSVRKFGAAALIIVGTVLVSGILSATRPDVTAASITAGFCVPVFYAAWSLFGKQVSAQYAPEVVLTIAFGVAGLVLLPFQFNLASPLPVSPRLLLWFAGLIGISTAAGFFLFAFGLKHLPAGVASILVMSEILFVSVYAYYFLGQKMTPTEYAGAFLVICGVAALLERPGMQAAQC